MKKYLFFTMVTLLALSTTARAHDTWGIGIGPLYNGLGLNIGKTTPSGFGYGALGCKSLSIVDSDDETNCGIGFGYIRTSIFASDQHGLGLNLGITYNSSKSQTELRLRPGYHYFFNGSNSSGVNLGIGAILYYDTKQSNDQDKDYAYMFLNIGYQF